MVKSNICESSIRNLLHITPLVPKTQTHTHTKEVQCLLLHVLGDVTHKTENVLTGLSVHILYYIGKFGKPNYFII